LLVFLAYQATRYGPSKSAKPTTDFLSSKHLAFSQKS
jgi:hypothetical protein